MLKAAQRKQYTKSEPSSPLLGEQQQAVGIAAQSQQAGQINPCLIILLYNFDNKSSDARLLEHFLSQTSQSDRNQHKNPYSPLEIRPSLELVALLPPIIKQEEQQPINNPSNPQARPISLASLSRLSQQSSKRSQQSSIIHNFQKHTVVTIKKLTRNIGAILGSSPTELVVKQMWNIFLASGLQSKRMLVVLFGCLQLQEERYKDLLKGCFFGELCNYDQTVVRAAQQLLRERAVRENIERNRHIKKRDNFYAYFMQFTEMLRNGPLVKFRISSKASQRIFDRIQMSASLQTSSKTNKCVSKHFVSIKKISRV